ncbi:histone-lysine N-methyltransferase SETD7 isoform X1 [Lethenteron reissneri]|uniref:histone-lysine N-methyltransferase SETD7 isoform X1 n=1 Tax=Lethenteron reissneri TaxID=7753 RepID=UPI002AB64DFD|nr:histone-lysine N-methyltransferase SETD7 isoform X1 [Lethenteron reissneri]
MDSDEDDVEETVIGPLDDDQLPHGSCRVTYSSGDCFEGHFVHGEKNGLGKFFFFDGSTLEGHYVEDVLQGQAVYTAEDGSTVHGTYVDGELHGSAREYDPEGRITFRGQYRDNLRCGLCWIYFSDGGRLVGEVNSDGEMTGDQVAYVYPDGRTAFYGRFSDGEMISAQPAIILGLDKNEKPRFEVDKGAGPILCLDKSTSTVISSQPLCADLYEKDRVCVGQSLITGAAEGLFAKVDMETGTVAAFYNGTRITHEEVDARDWSLNGNTISLDDDIVIDVPKHFVSVERYCASLGHKANHSFTPNCKYDFYNHPRFGPIKCVRTVRAVYRDEELTVAYGYDHNPAGKRQAEAPEWYIRELEIHSATQG